MVEDVVGEVRVEVRPAGAGADEHGVGRHAGLAQHRAEVVRERLAVAVAVCEDVGGRDRLPAAEPELHRDVARGLLEVRVERARDGAAVGEAFRDAGDLGLRGVGERVAAPRELGVPRREAAPRAHVARLPIERERPGGDVHVREDVGGGRGQHFLVAPRQPGREPAQAFPAAVALLDRLQVQPAQRVADGHRLRHRHLEGGALHGVRVLARLLRVPRGPADEPLPLHLVLELDGVRVIAVVELPHADAEAVVEVAAGGGVVLDVVPAELLDHLARRVPDAPREPVDVPERVVVDADLAEFPAGGLVHRRRAPDAHPRPVLAVHLEGRRREPHHGRRVDEGRGDGGEMGPLAERLRLRGAAPRPRQDGEGS